MKKRLVAFLLLIAALLPVVVAAAPATTLEVVWMAWPKDMVDKLIAGFEKQNPGIKVDAQLVPFTQLFQTLEVRLPAGGTPDVYLVDGPLTPSYAARGFLLPLDQYFTPTELKAWFPSSIETSRYQGKLYSIPYATSSAGLYFNKAIFKKYGIPFPSERLGDRLTWEEVAQIAKKLTIDENKDGQVDVWGLLIEQIDRPYQLLPLAQSKGTEAISPDGLKTEGYITSKPFVEAAEFYWKLFNEWKVSPQGIPDAAKSREYFGNGKAAMMLGAEWNIARLAAFKGLDFGLSPHPYFAGGKAVTPTGSWHVGINAKTTKKDAALAFLKYITGPEAAIEWHKLFGHAPARPDVYDAMPEVFSNPMWQILLEEMKKTAVARPVTPGFLEYELMLRETFNSIHYGANPEEELKNAAKRIDRELRKYR
ncbi:MAG: ABC transporter substrate-binding protein [Firmicutes bacterium]|nr:ABC transporter substrate-binding protein [Bacillota bacterium]